MTIEERIEKWSMPEPNTGCRIWIGARNWRGYARMTLNGKQESVTRWLLRDQLGPGMVPDHLCRNRPCIEIRHLEAITAKENNRRGTSPSATNARKLECIKGHPLSGTNLYMRRSGWRGCRECERRRQRVNPGL